MQPTIEASIKELGREISWLKSQKNTQASKVKIDRLRERQRRMRAWISK